MTVIEYLNSPFEQLKTREELLELKSVMARYDVHSVEELDLRLRDAETRKATVRRLFDSRKREILSSIVFEN